VVLLALIALAGVYLASQRIITRTHPLPPSRLHASSDRGAIARGKHLVAILGCTDCHRPDLQGTFIPDFQMRSRNLTRLTQTYSDSELDRAVRKGLRPDGTSVAEEMPSDAFQFVTDADMSDILSYLRSLSPAGPDVAAPSYDIPARIQFLQGKKHTDQYWFPVQTAARDLGTKFARGRELAMAACGECHMTALTGGPPDIPGPRPPDLLLVASYDEGDFTRLMRTGKAAGNRELPLMSATARSRFAHFSDAEIAALYDYLAARGRTALH
jgi:cytochrome c553